MPTFSLDSLVCPFSLRSYDFILTILMNLATSAASNFETFLLATLVTIIENQDFQATQIIRHKPSNDEINILK